MVSDDGIAVGRSIVVSHQRHASKNRGARPARKTTGYISVDPPDGRGAADGHQADAVVEEGGHGKRHPEIDFCRVHDRGRQTDYDYEVEADCNTSRVRRDQPRATVAVLPCDRRAPITFRERRRQIVAPYELVSEKFSGAADDPLDTPIALWDEPAELVDCHVRIRADGFRVGTNVRPGRHTGRPTREVVLLHSVPEINADLGLSAQFLQ